MKIPLKQYLSLLSRYLAAEKRRVGLLFALLVGGMMLQVGNPQIVRAFIDGALEGEPQSRLVLLAGLFILLAVIGQVAAVCSTFLSETIGWTATNALRSDFAAHLLRLDMSFHKTRTALWLDTDNNFEQRLRRESFRGDHSERWLQKLLFDHPELIPLNYIEPGSGGMIPICEELRLPGGVRVDILGVTGHGRPVLVECKLWRNPQARREVVAQLFEYAALFARWTYSDLEAQLKAQLSDWAGENPLFAHVRNRLEEPDEARFVDLFTRSLRAGDFHLIIAGDGIREDIHSIASHITGNGARLALVEFQLWTDDAGRTLVVPNVPVKTEVIRQRLIVAADGARVELDEPASDEEAVTDPEKAATWAAARAFWERFINKVHFDHPDQPAPRHGGHNTVRLPLPQPAERLTAYRTGRGEVGFYLSAGGNEWLFDSLREQESELRGELGLAGLRFHAWNNPSERGFGIDSSIKSLGDDHQQLTWLCDTANRLVTALRPRLSALDVSRDS